MSKAKETQVPAGVLLSTYQQSGAYTDCFFVDIALPVSHEAYIEAFFTSTLFKFERWILAVLVLRPSTNEQALLLAQGRLEKFAAWTVEGRTDNELLMSDFLGRTRLWMMSSTAADVPVGCTRLYFGSAYVPRINRRTGLPRFGPAFHALKGLHDAYSRALLNAAVAAWPTQSSSPEAS